MRLVTRFSLAHARANWPTSTKHSKHSLSSTRTRNTSLKALALLAAVRKEAEPEAAQPAPVVIEQGERDMLKLLQDVALGIVEATPIQVRAAIAAVQYTHTKRADGGKKEEQAEKAKRVSGGKFAASAPPKLVVNNR